MMKPIRVSATCVADVTNASPSTRVRKLQPFKYGDRGEGAGRSAYYKPTIHAVRDYHRNNRDAAVIRQILEKLQRVRDDGSAHRNKRTKARLNINALYAYQDIYGNRQFKVQPSHRISVTIGGVTVKAPPDLWVTEGNATVLIKLGVARHKSQLYVDLMLHLIRKAAIASGYRVRARNVVYLDVARGKELISSLPLSYFNRTLSSTCRHIAQLWDRVPPPRNCDKD